METYDIDDRNGARDRIDNWLHLLRQLFVKLEYVSTDANSDRRLKARVESRNFADFRLHRISSTRQWLERAPQRVTDSEEEYLLVALQVQGIGSVTQFDRRATLRPGDITVYDTTAPYVLDFDAPFEQVVVSVPRARLACHVPDLSRVTARPIAGSQAIAQLLGSTICSLSTVIDSSPAGTHGLLSNAVLDLIAVNLQGFSIEATSSASKLKRYHRERVLSYIRQHLPDPDLTVTGIATALDMSVSSLYRSFSEQGLSVAETIWAERIEAARDVLLDPRHERKSIKEIAFDLGFSDPAHFCRMFRRCHGCSPGRYRLTFFSTRNSPR